MPTIQTTNGKVYEADTTHKLVGQKIIKRAHCGAGMIGKVVGIRRGARATDLYAFIVEYPGQCHLISRRDFKVVN